MSIDSDFGSSHGVSTHRRPLPHHLRLLFVGPVEPPWALLALRLESAGCDQSEFDWEQTDAGALARLRQTAFDCVVILCDTQPLPASSNFPLADASGGQTDRPDVEASRFGVVPFVEGLRASGSDDPIAVLVSRPNDERARLLDELDCHLLVSTAGWHSRALIGVIRRAVVEHDLGREVADLKHAAQRERTKEHESSASHLDELRRVVERSADAFGRGGSVNRGQELDQQIGSRYQDVLRTYVMMGSGNLDNEVRRLARLLLLAGFTPTTAMRVHLAQLKLLLKGLGRRTSRHVMGRADLLAMELLLQMSADFADPGHVRGLGDAGVDLLHAESLLCRE